MRRSIFIALLALGVISTVNNSLAGGLSVFPGAEGFGVTTPAGRGGNVYRVTNLNPSGLGSLKYCIDQSGPRVCVFEVSGTIKLPDSLAIRNPFITIAGQTAPSPGITLRGSTLIVHTHDVLVQHIRVRAGDDPEGTDPHMRDSILISGGKRPAYNIVIDHVSASWAVDENIGMWHKTANPSLRDITVSNSIISEGLLNSIHPKGPHSRGLLITPGAENIAIIRNLFAHNHGRNPKYNSGPGSTIVNNLVYNSGYTATYLSGKEGRILKATVVGNVYITGFDTKSHRPIWIANLPQGSEVYLDDNMRDGNVPSDPWASSIVEVQNSANIKVSSPPVWASPLTVRPSSQVKDCVLANVGARPADRDSVDARIINDVREGTGRVIDSPSEVGGWPDLAENYRALILPDNPNGDDDRDGYTNLEEWLHVFAADVEVGCFPGDTTPPAPSG